MLRCFAHVAAYLKSKWSGSMVAKNRDALADAFMALLADRSLGEIALTDIAERAGLSLAGFREEFSSLMDVLGHVYGRIDASLLSDIDPDMAEEEPRERLFDLLMGRIDILAKDRQAWHELARGARADWLLAAELNRLECRSQRWVLEAAGIDTAGVSGALRIQYLSVAFARLVDVWLKDDDPALSSTMAELDRLLKRAEMMASGLHNLRSMLPFGTSRRAEGSDTGELNDVSSVEPDLYDSSHDLSAQKPFPVVQ